MMKIGLALSGGGFRATLFHLGAIRALREHKLTGSDKTLLDCVTHVSSVSGGSVLAAHFALKRKLYLGKDPEFEAAASDLLKLVRSDVRGHIVRSLPVLLLRSIPLRLLDFCLRPVLRSSWRDVLLSWVERNRTASQLEQHFKRSFRNKDGKLAMLSDLPGSPAFMLLGTNVRRRCLCAFTRQGFDEDFLSREKHPPKYGSGISIAQAVAASASFPGLFRPVNLDRSHLASQGASQLVWDAGIHDNLGVSALRDLAENGTLDIVLVSDATKGIKQAETQKLKLLSSLVIPTDLIQSRSKQLQEQLTPEIVAWPSFTSSDWQVAWDKLAPGPKYVYFRISTSGILQAPRLSEEHQDQIKLIRTDLDSFSEIEIRHLVLHGYCVTWHKLKSTLRACGLAEEREPGDSAPQDKEEGPCYRRWEDRWPFPLSKKFRRFQPDKRVQEIERVLTAGGEHKWRLFSLGDRDTIFGLIIIAILACASWLVIQSRFTANEGLSDLPDSRSKAVNKWGQEMSTNQTLRAERDSGATQLAAAQNETRSLKSNISALVLSNEVTQSALETTRKSASELGGLYTNAAISAEALRGDYTNALQEAAASGAAYTKLAGDLERAEALRQTAESNAATFKLAAFKFESSVSDLENTLSMNNLRLTNALSQISALTTNLELTSLEVERLKSQLESTAKAFLSAVGRSLPQPLCTDAHPLKKAPAEEPNPHGIVYHSIDRIFDFRLWTNAASCSTNGLADPCRVLTHYVMERASYRTEPLQLPFKTSGKDVFPFAYEPFKEGAEITYSEAPPDSTMPKAKRLWVRLDKTVPDAPFELWTGATYWNAFQSSNQWWAGFQVSGNVRRFSLGLLFPDFKPASDYKLYSATNTTVLNWMPLSEYHFMTSGSNYVFAEFENPKSYLIYAVHWRW